MADVEEDVEERKLTKEELEQKVLQQELIIKVLNERLNKLSTLYNTVVDLYMRDTAK